jgi:hypothetical protein
VQIGEAGFALLCKRHTYVDNYNSILVFTLGHGVTVGSSWLHFMKKCGVHCHSAVDVDFENLPFVYKECTAFTVLNVRASQIPKSLTSLD